VADIARGIAAYGSFNFILSDGELFFAHCSTALHYVVRAYPFRDARLIDCDMAINFSQHNHLDDRIAVIATAPLTTGEAWTAFEPGEIKMFVHGAPYSPGSEPFSALNGLPISY
jgi:glutamine amidotransferase